MSLKFISNLDLRPEEASEDEVQHLIRTTLGPDVRFEKSKKISLILTETESQEESLHILLPIPVDSQGREKNLLFRTTRSTLLALAQDINVALCPSSTEELILRELKDLRAAIESKESK